MIRRHRYLFTVRYRREGWKQPQQRQFLVKSYAADLVDKLSRPPTDGLAPLVELSVIRRELSAPEEVFRLEVEELL